MSDKQGRPAGWRVTLRAAGAFRSTKESPQPPGNLSIAADRRKVTPGPDLKSQTRLHLVLLGAQLGQVVAQSVPPALHGPPPLLDHLRIRIKKIKISASEDRKKPTQQSAGTTKAEYLSCLLDKAVLLKIRRRQSPNFLLLHPQELRTCMPESTGRVFRPSAATGRLYRLVLRIGPGRRTLSARLRV